MQSWDWRSKLSQVTANFSVFPSLEKGLLNSLLLIQLPKVAQKIKNLPAVWEAQVQSLPWEDLLEKGTEIHSRTLAWRIPRTEEPGGLQSMGSQRVRHH